MVFIMLLTEANGWLIKTLKSQASTIGLPDQQWIHSSKTNSMGFSTVQMVRNGWWIKTTKLKVSTTGIREIQFLTAHLTSVRSEVQLTLSLLRRLTGSLSHRLKMKRDTDLCTKVIQFLIARLMSAKLEAQLRNQTGNSTQRLSLSKDMYLAALFISLFLTATHMTAEKTLSLSHGSFQKVTTQTGFITIDSSRINGEVLSHNQSQFHIALHMNAINNLLLILGLFLKLMRTTGSTTRGGMVISLNPKISGMIL